MSDATGDGPGQALAAALQARAGRAPDFTTMLRTARVAAARAHATTRPTVSPWRQLVAASGVLAMVAALFVAHRGAGLEDDAQLARDLALARSLSPERQWHTPTDALIAARGYHTPVIVELPGIENPFKESVL